MSEKTHRSIREDAKKVGVCPRLELKDYDPVKPRGEILREG
jgi:hypothetical protein